MMSEAGKFTETILAVAKEKAQAIIREAESETQKALEEAKVHLSREAEDVVRNAQNEAEGIKRRHMSDVRHRLKILEQREKSRILSDVLDETRKRIIKVLSNEDEYFPYLVRLIEKGIRELGEEYAEVHLNSSDLKRLDKARFERELTKRLGKTPKMELSQQPIEALGGAIVSSKDGKMRIVNTLDQRFEALESKLLVEAGKILFEN